LRDHHSFGEFEDSLPHRFPRALFGLLDLSLKASVGQQKGLGVIEEDFHKEKVET